MNMLDFVTCKELDKCWEQCKDIIQALDLSIKWEFQPKNDDHYSSFLNVLKPGLYILIFPEDNTITCSDNYNVYKTKITDFNMLEFKQTIADKFSYSL